MRGVLHEGAGRTQAGMEGNVLDESSVWPPDIAMGEESAGISMGGGDCRLPASFKDRHIMVAQLCHTTCSGSEIPKRTTEVRRFKEQRAFPFRCSHLSTSKRPANGQQIRRIE